jgi:putative endonuclease
VRREPGRPDPRRSLGDAGEELAAAWYTEAGYRVVARKWRCADGEIDLVVARPGLVVFCEVKTRRDDTYGAPFEAVTIAKQRRLRGLAARWLREHPQPGAHLRFDVASVDAPRGSRSALDVIEGAF